jgi:hypothetical protein
MGPGFSAVKLARSVFVHCAPDISEALSNVRFDPLIVYANGSPLAHTPFPSTLVVGYVRFALPVQLGRLDQYTCELFGVHVVRQLFDGAATGVTHMSHVLALVLPPIARRGSKVFVQ